MKLRLEDASPRLKSRILEQLAKDSASRPRKAAAVECNTGDAPLGKEEVQGRSDERFRISVVSYRKRLADEDGLCEKYMVDCCRYAGLIPQDSPDVCSIQTSQKKVAKGEPERTEIIIEKIP